MKEISVIELKSWRESGVDFQLVDIREDYEFQAGNLGGQHIPWAPSSEGWTNSGGTSPS